MMAFISFSFVNSPPCSSNVSFANSCNFTNVVAFTTLHIFLIPESSICLTLSLVIFGENESQIFWSVSFSQCNPILLSITFFSLSESASKISLKVPIIEELFISFVCIFTIGLKLRKYYIMFF